MSGKQEIQEFWINEFRNDVEDEIDQIQLQLFEQWQNYREEDQGSANRKKYLYRDREEGHMRLYNDYFSSDPVYDIEIFLRRFRKRKELFLHIRAIRQLAYGIHVDHYDEYLCVAESIVFDFFCQGVIQIFGKQYLRKPNATDIQRLLQMHEQRHRFPGMLGSLDCINWEWKNCPIAWKGQFTRGDHGFPTIILEAVASIDLWIWHAFFRIAGSRNDINILNDSNLFDNVLQGKEPPVNFKINGTHYMKGYYLNDGIYLEFGSVRQELPFPQMEKGNCLRSEKRVQERMLNVHLEYFNLVGLSLKGHHECGIKNN
ncbi:uncharacterized protein LOC112517690 [Cynara cardunculus var. scolymus]|uniref:uncharacterized protein LOC112517690 n=1 Tax=Cynara cardunculus var. scolymus TaxID=59895 RepID=UPI000D628B73|nr:uncharacterized protein LOC112517690 [Cynara cardunculus var. scolymus]